MYQLLAISGNKCIDHDGQLNHEAMCHILVLPYLLTNGEQHSQIRWPTKRDLLLPYSDGVNVQYLETDNELCLIRQNLYLPIEGPLRRLHTRMAWHLVYQTGNQPDSKTVSFCLPRDLWKPLKDEKAILLGIASAVTQVDKNRIGQVIQLSSNWESADDVYEILKHPMTLGLLGSSSWDAVVRLASFKISRLVEIRRDAELMSSNLHSMSRAAVEKYFPHFSSFWTYWSVQ